MLYFNEEGKHGRIVFNDIVEDMITEELTLDESTIRQKYGSYNLYKVLYDLLYKGRIKNQAEVLKIYEEVKNKCDNIKYTYVDPSLYQQRNLYYDWSFWMDLYFKGNYITGDKGLDVFADFISRLLNDNRFNSYTKKNIVVPVYEWVTENQNLNDLNFINPMNLIIRSLIKGDINRFKDWKETMIIFLSKTCFFTIYPNYIQKQDISKFVNAVDRLKKNDTTTSQEINTDSKLVIMNHLAGKLTNSGIKVNSLLSNTSNMSKEDLEDSGLLDDPNSIDDPEIKKAALINKLEKIADKSNTIEIAVNNLDKEQDEKDAEWMREVLFDLQSNEGIKMNKARAARHDETQKQLLKKTIRNRTVKELLDQFETNDDIKESSIPIDNIDPHWHKVKFPNFNASYTAMDMQADITAMFYHFTNTTHPLNILDIKVENTSTSEDFKDTWTCKYEDAESGKRMNIVIDMPRLINNRFMKLRGNEKTLIGQLMLLPITKTEPDTVQVVSNYNKIFVRRKSPNGLGKSTPIVNKLQKVFDKYSGKEFKISKGDNKKVCSKYILPVAFIDLASMYNYIKFKDGSMIEFNMDNLKNIPWDRSKLEGNDKKLPEEALNNKYLSIYIVNGKKQPIIGKTVDQYLLDVMSSKSKEFCDLYNKAAVSKRLMYSEASILNSKIPVIICVAYQIGLQAALDKIGIKYEFSEKRPSKGQEFLKFNDGYLIYYPRSDADNMLLNGLMQIETDEYSIKEINGKDMWLNVLDEFGGRVKADGLDNFNDLMMDPVTTEICKILHIPSTYIDS